MKSIDLIAVISLAEIETFVAARNSVTSSLHPQSAGKTKNIDTFDTIDLPEKCTLPIIIIAIAAGIENRAAMMLKR